MLPRQLLPGRSDRWRALLNGLVYCVAFSTILSAAQSGRTSDSRGRVVAGAHAHTVSRSTPHLSFVAALSEDSVAPGGRLSVRLDVTPKAGMHVYAPGSTYRPVAFKLRPDPLLAIREPSYSEPTLYLFKPLNEQVLVYSAPFRIVIDVVAGVTPAEQARLRTRSRLTLKGALDYQACDDEVCYLPASVPLEWTVRVRKSVGN